MLGCGAVAPERFEQATLLQLLPALYYLQAPDDMIDSICWTVGQTLAIPDDQWSSSRVEHQWQQHTRTFVQYLIVPVVNVARLNMSRV